MHYSSAALALGLVTGATAAATYTSLRDAAMNIDRGGKPFYIGAATYPDCYSSYNCSQTMRSQVNMLVAENDCKFYATQGSPTSYTLTACQKAMDVATSNNQAFRGHVLLWKDVNYAPWLANLDNTTLRSVMTDHITKVMTHFKGKVPAWDVVNEAVEDSSPATGPIMRQDWVWAKTGADWIDVAFKTARAVDPAAKLFYNDYNIENTNAKADAVYVFVKDLVDRGIPIDGVGMQMHVQTNWYPSAARLGEMLDKYAALGLDVHVTELDIKCIAPCDPVVQGEVARTLLSTCLSRPNCKAFLTWGITDAHTWLEAPTLPLPFDSNYKPKPFFTQMLAALNEVATPNGPVNGLAPLPVPAPVVPSSAGPNDIVINKGVGMEAGWSSWSWGTDFDGTFAGPPAAPVGSSVIKGTSSNYGGVSLKGVVFATPDFESINFRFAPSSASPQLTVRIESTVENNYASAEIPIASVCPNAFVANEFQQCKVSLTTLGVHQFNRVSFMSKTGSAQVIYLNDIFAKRAPPATTASPTVAAVTVTTTATATKTVTAISTVSNTITSFSTVTDTTTSVSTTTSTESTTLTQVVTETTTSIVPTTTTATVTQTTTTTAEVTPTGHYCYKGCNMSAGQATSGCTSSQICLPVGAQQICVDKTLAGIFQ